jgi:hypothetical protein
MTPEQLTAIGRELYGERWKHPLARGVLADYRLVRRWANGATPIPPSIETLLMALLTRHRGKGKGSK